MTILKRFKKFGEIKNIDPGFKSKIFEEFMKKSGTQKNSGKHFTPRNIIDSMIHMSNIEELDSGSQICDPACGVGGFILEPMKLCKDGVDFYYEISGNEINPRFVFSGFDRGVPTSDDSKLIITLAKSNMLIFLSDLLKKNTLMHLKFANLFHSTFKLITNTTLGTLSKSEYEKYDLILTNPPYIVSGSSNLKKTISHNATLKKYYKTGGLGIESLFIEWIINSLKNGKKAFVVIPDGLLYRNDNSIRELITDECYIDAIISLPVGTFYNTPKKTFILAITKKPWKKASDRKSHPQTDPVFTYLVSEIGESLDKNRFSESEKNDLNEMVSLFNSFKNNKTMKEPDSERCKIQPFEKFSSEPFGKWPVDRWWTNEEKISLGIEKEEVVMDMPEFNEKINDLITSMENYKTELAKFS
ncbi:N-6 DNA methylase [Nitrosopumilus oxyclinae]|uniref:site-specific DNA-methyltransferase (adenine-specific) n=2 Tax=Nitrosopumilus oxyclinae TaxID=1959104 RepID=A0A7D5R4U3_9ARCH|nr:N-6 DNA methylase [Nitrosopumilus oxyclinae]